jgi:hypothetical protein
MVEFDLSWENSWRTNTYESNWDAAWVFIKFTPKSAQNWQHAILHYVNGTNDGHVAPAGATIKTAVNTYGTTTNGIGVFIHRSGTGIGNVNFQQVQLRWDYGKNGVGDGDIIEISVHGIEMVYVPQGSFYAGDGTGTSGQFEAGTSGNPLLVSSENQLTLGGANVNNLNNNNAANMPDPDDFNDVTTQTLPAAFPKGYNAMYCMKYECSQQQYATFLAHLSEAHRNARKEVVFQNNVNIYPIKTGNHFGEATFPWRAMEYINWPDMAAYLDWAGLRPMSELEYEKACRGPLNPIQGEFAWGTNGWYNDSYFTLENEGNPNEVIIEGIHESQGNGNVTSPYWGSSRPVRCGIFAASVAIKTREATGATYWGIMEMTGNCFERVISVGNAQSRDFSGLHGDGTITNTGNASFSLLTDWGFVSAVGVGFRNAEVSDRYRANLTNATRQNFYGLRGVRSAQ